MSVIHPVILCGGIGSRLRPLSTSHRPKPLLELPEGSSTLLAQTLDRVSAAPMFSAPTLLCGVAHAQVLSPPSSGLDVLAEPMPRGTGPAVLAAAASVGRGLVLALPADHHVASVEAFQDAVARGRAAALDGRIVVFGVKPTHAATGYGWIEVGPPMATGAEELLGFVEKPPLDVAEALLRGERHVWNSGMFLFEASMLLAHARELGLPWVDDVVRAVSEATREGSRRTLDAASFARCPNASFDVAIMERTDRGAVLQVDMGWDDVGTWGAVARHVPADEHGNVSLGPARSEDCVGTIVVSDGPRIAVKGLRDVLVAASTTEVMVVPRGLDTSVAQLSMPPWAERPWGSFARLDRGAGYQVKRLEVKPGGRTSLQRHQHRAELWTVVAGRAEVTVGDDVRCLEPGDAVTVPRGAVHRLANIGATPLVIIEVQTGSYLEEDDIERFDDDYGRVPPA